MSPGLQTHVSRSPAPPSSCSSEEEAGALRSRPRPQRCLPATRLSVSTRHLIPSRESPPSYPCGFQNRTESNLSPDLPEDSQKVKATGRSLAPLQRGLYNVLSQGSRAEHSERVTSMETRLSLGPSPAVAGAEEGGTRMWKLGDTNQAFSSRHGDL